MGDVSLRDSLVQKGLENVRKYDAEVIAGIYSDLYRSVNVGVKGMVGNRHQASIELHHYVSVADL